MGEMCNLKMALKRRSRKRTSSRYSHRGDKNLKP
jgi:hypothetical protein